MRGEGYCYNQEEWIQSFGRVKKFMHFDCLPSNLITFTFLCSLLNLCLHFFASVLGKDKDKESQLATLVTIAKMIIHTLVMMMMTTTTATMIMMTMILLHDVDLGLSHHTGHDDDDDVDDNNDNDDDDSIA